MRPSCVIRFRLPHQTFAEPADIRPNFQRALTCTVARFIHRDLKPANLGMRRLSNPASAVIIDVGSCDFAGPHPSSHGRNRLHRRCSENHSFDFCAAHEVRVQSLHWCAESDAMIGEIPDADALMPYHLSRHCEFLRRNWSERVVLSCVQATGRQAAASVDAR